MPNALTGHQVEWLEVAGEEGRDVASVIIELDAESFAEERFFGADANAVAEKKDNDGSTKRPPGSVSQPCGDHQGEHPEVNGIAHYRVRSLHNQFVPFNHTGLAGPLLAKGTHGYQAKPATGVRQHDGDSGQNHVTYM